MMLHVATQDLCVFCFRVLLAKLQGMPPPSLPSAQGGKVAGLFVSWHNAGAPRGCMGTLHPVDLERGLADYALTSALLDVRFQPISMKEVRGLTCHVSILHSFETCSDPLDWKVGTHGVTIHFSAAFFSFCPCGTCRYTATLLPEVISAEGLSQQGALDKLVRKAGYRGYCRPKLMKSWETTRFKSSAWDLSFDSFSAMQDL
ncbi:unnamed protein product [Effrenium voratum]|nr:unnamed protein product [Effrenium voratum]